MSAEQSNARRAADEADDPALVNALRAGDMTAFETVVRANGRAMLAVARRLLNNEDAAKEAVQDAFVSAFRARARFKGESRLSTWLHRIVVNVCLMRLRSARRKPEVSIEEWLPTFVADGHHAATFVDWSNTAYALVEQRETCALVRRAIEQLPDGYRTVLLLREIDGMTADEVAHALGMTPNAVNVRVHRARQALRTILDPSFPRVQSS